MEGVLSEGMCRCCASEGSFKDFQVPYQWMGVEEIYSNMMKDCFDISLMVTEDGNNGGICEVCITQLRNAFNFKLQVQQTELKFKRKLEERSFKADSIKMELSRDGDDDSNMSGDFSSNDYEVPIKVEKVEDKPKKRQAAKASTSKAKKSKASPGETSTKRALRQSEEVTNDTEEIPDANKELKIRKGKTFQIILNRTGVLKARNEVEKHQNNIKEILLNTNATPIRCRGGIGYTCCFCPEQFPDPADLKTHTLEAHDDGDKSEFMKGKDMHGYFVKLDITDFKCNICNENVDNIENMTGHLKNHHDKNLFTDLKNHILPFKFGSDSLSCFMCWNIFNSFKALQEHMNVHYRNYVCPICNAGFVNKNILLRHGDAHKTGTFDCEECSKTFDTARKKRLHDRSKHAGLNLPHKCGYCTERFKEVWKKYEHLHKVHGIKGPGVKCQACNKTFETKHAWRLHTSRVHLLQRYHKCSNCDMEFYTKKELESHMVKHTGTREFRCEICFRFYGRQKTLKDHVRRVHFPV